MAHQSFKGPKDKISRFLKKNRLLSACLKRSAVSPYSFFNLTTVNSEIFAIILFSRKALKDIFATLKISNKGMIYLYQ